jgi:protein TonB
MQMKFFLLPAFLGLLFASAIPSQAQTRTSDAAVDPIGAWKQKVSIQLASQKRFPREVGAETGTAKITFVVDRTGKLISRVLVESTGSRVLDAEALAMVERAAPFPELPSELNDDTARLTVPIDFSSRSRPWATGQWSEGWVEEQSRVDAKIHGICRGC